MLDRRLSTVIVVFPTWKMIEELMYGTIPRLNIPSLLMLPPVSVST